MNLIQKIALFHMRLFAGILLPNNRAVMKSQRRSEILQPPDRETDASLESWGID